MQLIDTHCHIHDPEFFSLEEAKIALEDSVRNEVKQMLCVGTDIKSSQAAIKFAKNNSKNCRAAVGIHPHDATSSQAELAKLDELVRNDEVIAIGECGLDFYYNDRKKSLKKQEKTLRYQIELAINNNLPISFHVREAFDDFWPIFDSYPKDSIKGVLHSFTDREANLEKALKRGLFIGVNGIATFTTHKWQLDLYKNLPLEKILLETDSPFLTPVPKRGKINKPENVIYITDFLAELRGEDADTIAERTTANARKLFFGRFS